MTTDNYATSKIARFYSSPEWQRTREAYRKQQRYICEKCGTPGAVAVHHIVHLTEDNVDDPNVSLSFDNLQLLCNICHANAHRKHPRRFVVDEDGNVIPI